MSKTDQLLQSERRRFMASLAALPLAGAVISTQVQASSRLANQLEGASITLIDGRKDHYYQPGFTLIAAGIKSRDYSISNTADYIPKGVNWIAEKAREIDPDGKKVVTDSGQSVPYDFLILASGLDLNYGAIEQCVQRSRWCCEHLESHV
jgi:sulfide:quinone oxidoreductase